MENNEELKELICARCEKDGGGIFMIPKDEAFYCEKCWEYLNKHEK